MIKHIWSLVCKESKIEHITNNMTIIDAYEGIQFELNTTDKIEEGKPIGAPFNFEVISVFFRDKKGTIEHLDQEIKVIEPSGKELGKFEATVSFMEDQNRVRAIMKFNMIALTSSGTYLFKIFTSDSNSSKKFKQVAEIPVDISLRINGEEL